MTFTSLAQQIYMEENDNTDTDADSTHKHRLSDTLTCQDKHMVIFSINLH